MDKDWGERVNADSPWEEIHKATAYGSSSVPPSLAAAQSAAFIKAHRKTTEDYERTMRYTRRLVYATWALVGVTAVLAVVSFLGG
jgi:hypothetical protein